MHNRLRLPMYSSVTYTANSYLFVYIHISLLFIVEVKLSIYVRRLLVEQDSLMSLVETHDVAGLLTALDTKDGPAFSMPLCPPSSKYSTREYLTKNKR